jgi:hypothetical protein
VLFGGAYDGVYGHEVGIVQNINVPTRSHHEIVVSVPSRLRKN